jgi:hypothetical protein
MNIGAVVVILAAVAIVATAIDLAIVALPTGVKALNGCTSRSRPTPRSAIDRRTHPQLPLLARPVPR